EREQELRYRAPPVVGHRHAAGVAEVELRGEHEVEERVEGAVVREAVAGDQALRAGVRPVESDLLVEAAQLRGLEVLRPLERRLRDDGVVRARPEVRQQVAGATVDARAAEVAE